MCVYNTRVYVTFNVMNLISQRDAGPKREEFLFYENE